VAIRITYSFVPADPATVMPDIESPIFLIHEENDDVVSWEEAMELFTASRDPANETWNVDSAAHSHRKYRAEYVARLNGFCSRTLTEESGVDRFPYC
jgi:fermentation-respiration switch protein FrsA (DUF1100 family)